MPDPSVDPSNTTLDTLKPYALRSVPTRVSEAFAAEAYQRKVTTGRLFEMMWAHWTNDRPADGQPMPHDAGELIPLLHAAAALAAHTKLPGAVRARINRLARGPQATAITDQSRG